MTVGLAPEALAPHAVRRWAASAPESVALAHVGGATITYGELDRSARRWAAAFQRLGAATQSVVATMLPNGPLAFEVWLGLGWLGAIEGALSPALKGRLLAAALGGSGATVLVTGPGSLDAVADVVADLPELRRVLVVASTDPPQRRSSGGLAACRAVTRAGPGRIRPGLGPDHGVSPFSGTELDAMLRAERIENLIVRGGSVNVGVLGTCIEAVNLGYRVVVPCDGVVGIPTEYAEAVLQHTIRLLAMLSTVDDIIDLWSEDAV